MNKKEIKTPDWHQADIKAALAKKGISMAELSRQNGLSAGTLGNVFRVKYPKAQEIIAGAIGIDAAVIWPSRY
ncbi:helix-turn-helix domain-containing protein [Vibrio harveyi]|uniref:helix-turn-helix domain-containing protein n=1 Tax=Vibrio harveyi TaxID=669 RepID=UPI000D781CF2|nr:helix-turn-helix transcriptional regulator [Vibrio harveyi]GBK97720.1 maltose metabolism regulator [Vibrio harveyi]HDM8061675.1 helix-turn-helix domain-containing protein [Vibrio harveyi]